MYYIQAVGHGGFIQGKTTLESEAWLPTPYSVIPCYLHKENIKKNNHYLVGFLKYVIFKTLAKA